MESDSYNSVGRRVMTSLLTMNKDELQAYSDQMRTRWNTHKTEYNHLRSTVDPNSMAELPGKDERKEAFNAAFDNTVTDKKWGGMYRELAPEQDELARTSGTRDFFRGMGEIYSELKKQTEIDKQKELDQQQASKDIIGTETDEASKAILEKHETNLKAFDQRMETYELARKTAYRAFKQQSSLRLPTYQTGYNFSNDEKMQHPTSGANGMFGRKNTNHNIPDTTRADIILTVIKGLSPDKDNESRDIFEQYKRAAVSTTLNMFTAPPLAEGQRVGNAGARKNVYGSKLRPAHNNREIMKHLGGGGTKKQQTTATWKVDKTKRELSPDRGYAHAVDPQLKKQRTED